MTEPDYSAKTTGLIGPLYGVTSSRAVWRAACRVFRDARGGD